MSPRITELYAYVVADSGPDDEGVPAFLGPDGAWFPMMGADSARAEQLRPHAVRIAAEMGRRVKLVRSTVLEVVEVIDPPPTPTAD